jgi:signal transduction histidine kinase
VQECLTNVGKHAPGATADVAVAWTPAAVTVHVANDASPVAFDPGRGIDGMTERARSLGGTLTTTYDGGRFHVTAVLPASPAPEVVP